MIKALLVVASRLGNGGFWYLLILGMALWDRQQGVIAAAHMTAVGLVGLVAYKSLKHRLVRERPYITWDQVRLGTSPMDLYSFPSGHTLHAVSFTIIAAYYYPGLGLILVPFAVLIALSRVVLGLHYPTDVAVGALIGATLATSSFYALL
jgi:undecaprenyl-diphosphatase